MSRNIVKAKLDIIFKKLFADAKNEDILRAFISDILDIPYDSINRIEITNPELVPESIDEKFSRMDVKLTVNNKLVNIEIQINNEGFFEDRATYHWARLFTSDLKSGEDYGQIKQCIAINIINFNMFDCSEYHSSFSIREDVRHDKLTDKCAIHFFELKKINKEPNPRDRKELWMQLINAENEEELDMLNNTNVPAIQRAVVVIKDMSADERIREAAWQRETMLHDKATALRFARDSGYTEGRSEGMAEGMKKGRSEGIAEGMEKGREEGRSEGIAEGMEKGETKAKAALADRMRAKGYSEDMIRELIGE